MGCDDSHPLSFGTGLCIGTHHVYFRHRGMWLQLTPPGPGGPIKFESYSVG